MNKVPRVAGVTTTYDGVKNRTTLIGSADVVFDKVAEMRAAGMAKYGETPYYHMIPRVVMVDGHVPIMGEFGIYYGIEAHVEGDVSTGGD